jgi:predicted MFS family arabinose efflux permease
MIAAVLGFGISGMIVERLKAAGGFYLDSLSFLVSGTLIFLIAKKFSASMSLGKVSKDIAEVIRKSVVQEIKEGMLYFVNHKDIRLTAGIMFFLWSALGAVYVVIIAFVQKTLHSATKDLGLLIMFLGIGLFVGSLIYGRFGQRISQYKVIFTSLALSGFMLIIFAVVLQNYPYFISAAALSLSLGIFISPIMIASNTIIHKVSDNAMMGKVFSSLEMVMHLAFLIFMFASSFLAERWGNFTILVIVGSLFSLLGLMNLVFRRRLPWLD